MAAAAAGGTGIVWSLIAAADRNGAIGIVDGDGARLPWRLPEDLAHFKRTTMGRPLVMGRRTFDSIGRPLPGRLNVVMTRQPGLALPAGVVVVADRQAAQAAVQAAFDDAQAPTREAFVIGGAEVFAQFMPLAQRLYLTEIDREYADANCRLADFEPARVRRSGWHEASRETQRSADGLDYAFVVYERRPRLAAGRGDGDDAGASPRE